MNLPNKLTLTRVIMVPFFVAFLLLTPKFLYFKWIALGIFIVASLTDLLDGKIARKYNLVTNFGKFMDPLADKLLVCSALIGMSSLGVIPAWITIIIIAREFIISGFRLIAAEKGVVIAASMWGKWKTTFQMVMLCVKMVVMNYYFEPYIIGIKIIPLNVSIVMLVGNVTMYIALVLTVVSLIDYLVKNKDVLKDVD
ncbi:MAG: CDP-diacylglycerol--glycerol-3-phosphate 3-phosphatidyltransferase [Lachnospiraceae bacterium]|nr:CDP-diacylglycerol--glycerol-3-phosphate 3-phosphatidyltransferase [Lachnospiraceae bacterium]